MKSLLKYLSPFAPDLAGAVSVFFELDGLIVICDAGGCTGNICGFDEPRWFTHKSALFSAGLRDMDAIMGRDRQLADKLIAAARLGKRKFISLIGSPVPAVIGTDFAALKQMCRKEVDVPVFALDPSGTKYYEEGASKAYIELFKTLAVETLNIKAGAVGVLGVTPLDYSSVNAATLIKNAVSGDLRIYGMGGTLEDIVRASEVEKNIVASPSGLKAAEYLQRKFGTPYEIAVPGICGHVNINGLDSVKKVLIVHQTFAADELKQKLLKQYPALEVETGSFFNALSKNADHRFASEEDFRSLFEQNMFDVVFADAAFERIVKDVFTGRWVDFPHFAVSGRLLEDW